MDEVAGPPANHRRRFAAAVTLISAAGLLLRLLHVERNRDGWIMGDGFDYMGQAFSAGQGDWFTNNGDPTAHHPPLWTLVLSVAHVAGLDTTVAMQRFTAVIGALTVAVVGYLGRRVAGNVVGVVAAALVAVYPGMWVMERSLLSEPLAILLGALMLLAFYRYVDSPSRGRMVAVAVLVTLAGLTRAELMGMGAVLAVVVWRRSPPALRLRVANLALCALPPLLFTAPWVALNAGRFEEPVILSTGMGTTMLVGACDEVFHGDLVGSFDQQCSLREVAFRPDLDRSQLDTLARSKAISYTEENLERVPLVVLAREGRTFGLFQPFEDSEASARWAGGSIRVYDAWAAAFLVVLPLSIVGLVQLRRRGRAVFPLLSLVALAALASGFTFGQMRYRSVAEISFLVLAAVPIASIVGRWSIGSRFVGTAAHLDEVADDRTEGERGADDHQALG